MPPQWHSLRQIVARCLTDLRLANILMLGVITSVVILPFGVYRLASGQVAAGAVDLVLVAGILSSMAYALRSGRTGRAGSTIVAFVTLGSIGASAFIGLAGVLWVYPALVGNFMLARRPVAIVGNVLVIFGALMVPGIFQSPAITLTFVVTTLVVGMYAFAYAWLTDQQRTKLEGLATRDPLTGLANRRVMEAELAAVARKRPAAGAAVAVLDLDHFKAVNDLHGHDAGDQVLTDFARIAQLGIRKADRLFRFGGEEFVLLVPDVDQDGATAALERLHDALRTQLRSPSGAVGCSIGAAILQPGEDWSAWLARADAALYQAKDSGRNRICMHDPAPRPLAFRSERRAGGEVAA